jgi:hypothetical protein
MRNLLSPLVGCPTSGTDADFIAIFLKVGAVVLALVVPPAEACYVYFKQEPGNKTLLGPLNL